MLVLYSAFLSFPSGGPASNFPVPIRVHASNQAAQLFTDQSGAVGAENPPVTDGDGQVMFWSAPGDYEALLAGERFHIPVDGTFTDPTWPGLWTHVQDTPLSVWSVVHHFGVRPSVDVLVDGQVSEADVSHTDENTTVITFGSPVSGIAHLRR